MSARWGGHDPRHEMTIYGACERCSSARTSVFVIDGEDMSMTMCCMNPECHDYVEEQP